MWYLRGGWQKNNASLSKANKLVAKNFQNKIYLSILLETIKDQGQISGFLKPCIIA